MGYLHVDDMLDELSIEQWEEWKEYDEVQGLGNRRVYEVMALVGAALCMCQGAKDINETYFMPWVKPREKTAEDLVALSKLAIAASETYQ